MSVCNDVTLQFSTEEIHNFDNKQMLYSSTTYIQINISALQFKMLNVFTGFFILHTNLIKPQLYRRKCKSFKLGHIPIDRWQRMQSKTVDRPGCDSNP